MSELFCFKPAERPVDWRYDWAQYTVELLVFLALLTALPGLLLAFCLVMFWSWGTDQL